MTKTDLLNKLERLSNGLPTDLVYINRTIDNIHVQAPKDYKVSTIDAFLEKDLQTVASFKGSKIRAILGHYGSGKTTVLNRIEDILPQVVSPDKYLFIRINLEKVSVFQHQEFLNSLMKQIFPVLVTAQFKSMCDGREDEELAQIFQSVELVKKIEGLTSKNPADRNTSQKYFYDQIGEDEIFRVVEGVIQLANKTGMFVIILVDELESLISQDREGRLTEIMTSQFMRGIYDRHPKSVYIAFTCHKETYDQLKKEHYKFYRITENRELVLSALSDSEKREITEQILKATSEFTFGKLKADEILNGLKGTLDYFMSTVVKLIIAKVCEYIDQTQEMCKQVPNIYEKNAREQKAVPKLLEWKFNRVNIKDEPEVVAGFHFDIFASGGGRSNIKKRAFGEIKSSQCSKGWAEEFINWLDYQILHKTGEYEKNRDKLLFIAPEYTPEAKKLLEERGVECLTFEDTTVKNILQGVEQEKIKDLSEKEQEVIEFLKSAKSGFRALSKMESKFPPDLLEQLVQKSKIELKDRRVRIKKTPRN